jgi:hypothetical protein
MKEYLDLLVWNQNNVSKWSDMFTHWLLLQWASPIKSNYFKACCDWSNTKRTLLSSHRNLISSWYSSFGVKQQSLTRSWRDNDFISKYRSIQAIWQLFKLKNITKNEDKIFTSNYPRKWHIWVWGHDVPLYTGVCTIQVQHTAELEAILVIWSYGSWIYNYLCNQCLSPLKLWVWILLMVRCTRYNIMW